jgi:enediyne biosynthesis protein E4
MAEVRSGGSYLSQSDLRLHFGLGETMRIDKVEVQWPNGMTQVFQGLMPIVFIA